MTPSGGLTEELRARTDEDLASLFAVRPDLLVPLPPDVDTLAVRALSRWSISAALAGLDLWCGELAQALVALPAPTSYAAVGAALDAEPADVARGLDRLCALALAWGEPTALAVAPPLHGMLSASLARPSHPMPPPVGRRQIGAETADRAAGAAAAGVVRLVDELVESWGAAPPAVLKSGGLGLRDSRRTAAALDVPEETAVVLAEVAYAGGLVAASPGYDAVWLPTPTYDAWQTKPVGARWIALATAWLGMPRAPGRALTRDERGKTRTALSPELMESREPDQRRALLQVLAELPSGAAATPGDVVAIVQWQRPLTFDPQLAVDTLTSAELLGVTGRAAMTTAGRALLAGQEATAAAAVNPHLPALLDSVLLQADLTAVAPGPLAPTLASELRLLADVESTGGATVYRFSEASLRRAFDAGRSADDVLQLLHQRSRTPVPQALGYLIEDVGRRHGRIRVGSAQAVLRCDDEALLAEVLATRRAGALRLRRLAPTVLAAQAPVEAVVDALRAAGFAPAIESAEGTVVVERPPRRRTPAPTEQPGRQVWPPQPRPEQVQAAVRALRAGERAARHRPAEPGTHGPSVTTPMETLHLLRQAARDGRGVWIGYLNAAGVASTRIIEPAFVDGGYVTAFDHRRGERRTFAAHRITSAALVSEDEL